MGAARELPLEYGAYLGWLLFGRPLSSPPVPEPYMPRLFFRAPSLASVDQRDFIIGPEANRTAWTSARALCNGEM